VNSPTDTSALEIERLTWIPLLVDRLEESGAWEELRDYQFAWYIKLLVKSTRSSRRGYLRLDTGILWKLAGSHSRDYFERHWSAVLERFKVREIDGEQWIYSPTMLEVLAEQTTKYRRKFPQNAQGKLVQGKREALSLSMNLFSDPKEKPPARVYVHADFDERDLRKLNDALTNLYRVNQGNITRDASPSEGRTNERMLFLEACERAGISVERGRCLFNRASGATAGD